MDKTESLKRIRKVCSRLRIILLVCFFGIGAVLLINIALTVFSLMNPGMLPVESELNWFSLLSVTCNSIPAFACVWLMLRMFSEIAKSETPFLGHQAKRIRWISFFIFLDVVLGVLLSPALLGATTSGVFELGFASSNSTPTYYVNIDVWEAFLALLLFCLSYVFEYGALLQQESDDTL